MRKQLALVASTLLALLLLDATVGMTLRFADGRIAALQGLVGFFDYGRSVPGKLQAWVDHPGTPGNLFDVAWRTEMIAASASEFATAPPDVPVVRGYSMSFVNNILEAAQHIDPALHLALRAGPGAPPNFTYATFLDDRANRRKGDVVVLGILSSGVAAMGSLSNRTWVFEQPAPFTYPVFRPDEGDGLRRIDPLVNSAAEERALATDPVRAAAWAAQLRDSDALWTAAAFVLPVLDHSPFMRLVRRSLAISTIRQREQSLLAHPETGAFPYAVILGRMAVNFARIARQDGQIPIVVLVQTRDLSDPDVLALLQDTLKANDIPYVATEEHQSPKDPAAFVPDGHYQPQVNAVFGQAFLDVVAAQAKRP